MTSLPAAGIALSMRSLSVSSVIERCMESRELVKGESRDPQLSALFCLSDRCPVTSCPAAAAAEPLPEHISND